MLLCILFTMLRLAAQPLTVVFNAKAVKWAVRRAESQAHVSLLLVSVSLGKGYFHLVMCPTSPDMKVR